MTDQVFFGVGCFNFGIKRLPPFTLKGQEYIKELKQTLESIPNVDKVSIEVDTHFAEFSFEVDEKFSEIDEDLDFFPSTATMLEIEFEIYIPERLQQDLFLRRIRPNLDSERFRIHIRSSYFFPVTFIEVLSPKANTCTPSDAVMIVREFLKVQFEKINSNFLRFEILGPSPFHADFCLQSGESDNHNIFDSQGFAVSRIPLMGYDKYNIIYDSSIYNSPEEALSHFYVPLCEELGFFYRLVLLNNIQIRKWHLLERTINELLALQKAKRLKAIRNGLRNNFGKIYDTVVAIADFETDQIMFQQFSKHEYLDFQLMDRQPYVETHLKRQLETFPDYPTGQIRDIVTLLEGRRSQAIENTIIIVAAIIGGIAGSILTLFIAKP